MPKTIIEVSQALNDALQQFKKAVWDERYNLIWLVLLVWSFLAGAAIEHYFPEYIARLWH